MYQLDDLIIVSSLDPSYTLVVTDASIKNNVTTSIAHIHICNKLVIKTLHHTVNIIIIKAELFAIRCGINQATSISSISKIVTDLLHAAWRIFWFFITSIPSIFYVYFKWAQKILPPKPQ